MKKIGLSCLQSNACRVLPTTGDNSLPTRHNSPALLKGPELCGLSHLSALPYFTKHQQQTHLLPSSIASASSSLKRGSLCSKAKARVLPSPAQSLARQLHFVQNKWIFQLWVTPQETEFQCSGNTCTKSRLQHPRTMELLSPSKGTTQEDATHYFRIGKPRSEGTCMLPSVFLLGL